MIRAFSTTILLLLAGALAPPTFGGSATVPEPAALHAGTASDTVHVAPPTGARETDRASILAALQTVDPGGTVVFAPGTYAIGGLNLDVAVPGITLLGHPDGTTIRGCEPDVFGAYEVAMFACNALGLSGGHQTVRGLTFEYAWHGITIGCCLPTDLEQLRSGAWRPEPTRPGGDIIEGNTFRYTPNGLRVLGRSAERTVIRENQFVDVYHAIGINGGGVDFLDNRIYTDQPHRVPTSMHPGDAINISPAGGPGDHTTCSDNVVKGNRIEGYTHGIRIAVDAPDTSCRRNVIRGNTIAVQRVPFVTDWFDIGWSDEADSTVVGVPLGLINYPMIEPGGDGPPESNRIPVIEDNVIDGNEITGGYGLGIEVAHASRNRIVNNSIRGIRAREPFPGNVLSEPVLWAKANGSGIWLSPGSDGNEIVGNVLEDIAAYAVFLEGDDNRVELRSAGDSVRDLGSENEVTRSGGQGERSPEEQTSDTVHVAPPIGETDSDRVSVQAAFDAVQPGGTVAFAAGIYVIGGDGLVLRTPGVALIGHPAGTTLQGCTREQRVGLEANDFPEACGDGLVLAAEAQRVSSLRFESLWLALSIREATESEKRGRTPGFSGGHVVENNSFHDGLSFQVDLDADSTIRIRRNVFRNTWHAVAIYGRNIHVTDNDIAVPEPERVPFGFAGVAIGIRPLGDDAVCSSMVVAGNRIDGHTEAVAIAVFPQDPPGAECSHITIRDNEIVMRRVRRPDGSDQAGRLAIAPAIRLFNAQRLVGEGLMTWGEIPEGGWPAALSDGRISDVRVVGNHITGAVGVAIEAAHVTDSRIVNNEIEVRPATTPEELDGLELGGNGGPGVWVLLGLVDEVNGTPVWVSQGSEDNIVRNPQ